MCKDYTLILKVYQVIVKKNGGDRMGNVIYGLFAQTVFGKASTL